MPSVPRSDGTRDDAVRGRGGERALLRGLRGQRRSVDHNELRLRREGARTHTSLPSKKMNLLRGTSLNLVNPFRYDEIFGEIERDCEIARDGGREGVVHNVILLLL